MIIKWFLPVYFVIYLLVAFVLPSWRVYKQTGIKPVTFSDSENAHDYIGRMFRVIIRLTVLVIAIFIISPSAYSYSLPAFYLEVPAIQWMGVVLCILSLIWTSIAQTQMSTSWRIGIDEHHKTELKQHGLFSVSRNPIFLGMLVTLLGIFLTLPNAVSLAVLVASFLLIQIQVRLEEEFLEKHHGENYRAYRKKTRRFI